MITRDLHEGAEACLCSLCEKALQIICIYTFPAYCFKQTNLSENSINSTFWFHSVLVNTVVCDGESRCQKMKLPCCSHESFKRHRLIRALNWSLARHDSQ